MVVHAYYPLAEPRVQREARAAQAAGFSVEIVCLRGHGEPKVELLDGIQVTRLNVEHNRGAPFFHLLFEYSTFAIRATIFLVRRALRTKIALVQIHSPPEFLVVAAIIPKLLGASVILDVHDLSRHMFGARFHGDLAGRFGRFTLKLIERLSCWVADRVVTVHVQYQREMQAIGVPGDRISVVMNAPDEEVIERAKASPSTKNSHDFVIAYHGTLNPWYGVDLILDAVGLLAERLSDVSAVIAGDGDALGDLLKQAQRLQIADRVRFTARYIPIVDALALVREASCGVIPNRPTELNRFALSSKLFEYVALEIPVVVARLETLASHFSEDEVTFFDPGSAESLARAIESVARDPQAARAKAKRALERFADYSWQRNASRYVTLLETAVGWTSPAFSDTGWLA